MTRYFQAIETHGYCSLSVLRSWVTYFRVWVRSIVFDRNRMSLVVGKRVSCRPSSLVRVGSHIITLMALCPLSRRLHCE